MNYRNDPALVFFASASGLLLLVSMPATYAVVAPFHSSGDWLGIGLALATLLAFEVGAIGCKLVTLAIPKWGLRMNLLTIVLLSLTTVANYSHGYDLFSQASLAPTLATIRNAGYAPLVASVYSATIPILLFVFLSATVARVKQLQISSSHEPSLAEQRDRAILAALDVLSERLAVEASPSVALASPIPASPSKPVVALPLASSEEVASYQCPHCARPLAKPGLVGLAKRYGYCKACKDRRADGPMSAA